MDIQNDGTGLLNFVDFNGVDAREHLGNEMPVSVYRAFKYALFDELVSRFSRAETEKIIYAAGRRMGIRLYQTFNIAQDAPITTLLKSMAKTLESLKMGLAHVELVDEETGFFQVTLAEDLDCSGLPMTGQVFCAYDEGLLAGVFETHKNTPYTVDEVDCWTTGGRVCRFVGNPTRK